MEKTFDDARGWLQATVRVQQRLQPTIPFSLRSSLTVVCVRPRSSVCMSLVDEYIVFFVAKNSANRTYNYSCSWEIVARLVRAILFPPLFYFSMQA